MLRTIAVAALTCLPLPTLAQDTPLVDHVANMFLGMQSGYRAYLGSDVLVPIKQHGPGVFEVSAEGQRSVVSTITQLEPCVFNYEAKIGTRSPQAFQLYFQKLLSVAYRSKTTDANGLTTLIFEVEYQPGFIVREGKPIDTTFIMRSLTTDVPVASLDASVAALKAGCPTEDPTKDMVLVDHVASLTFGLHHGYHIPIGGSAAAILRTGPGVFVVSPGRGVADLTTNVVEVSTCLFEVQISTGRMALPKARVDATRLTSVTYTPTKTETNRMTTYAIHSSLEAGFRVVVNSDGTTKPEDVLPDTVVTDAPLALLDGSIAAILAACP